MDVRSEVYARLDALGIPYQSVQHPPVHTIEDCAYAERALNAVVPKNLFLTPRNQSAFYLVLASPSAMFRTADVSRQIGSSRLSFAPEEPLMRLMCTKPGAISPMGLLFDEEREIHLYLDRALAGVERLAFHPCVNTETLAMTREAFFERYLPAVRGANFGWVSLQPQ